MQRYVIKFMQSYWYVSKALVKVMPCPLNVDRAWKLYNTPVWHEIFRGHLRGQNLCFVSLFLGPTRVFFHGGPYIAGCVYSRLVLILLSVGNRHSDR